MIRPGSKRSFQDALHLAGLEPPSSDEELADRFLHLLVAGVDHEMVGTNSWVRSILDHARCQEPVPRRRRAPSPRERRRRRAGSEKSIEKRWEGWSKIVITPGSKRSFVAALNMTGLPTPTTDEEFAECYLQLLLLGVDHELVGKEAWYGSMFGTAPDVRELAESAEES